MCQISKITKSYKSLHTTEELLNNNYAKHKINIIFVMKSSKGTKISQDYPTLHHKDDS